MAKEPELARLDARIDSREGIEALADWARAGGWVLTEWHEKVAQKYGVSFDGVIVSRPLPLANKATPHGE